MSAWGRDIGEKQIGAYRVKILTPRPPSVLAFLNEAQKWGDREFIIFDDRRISFRQFIAASSAAAERFKALGFGKGDMALLNAANSPEFLAAFWGVLRCGGVVVLGNAWWSGVEAEASTRDIDVRLVIADAKRRALASGRARLETLPTIAVESLASCFTASDVGGLHYADADEEAPAALIFTSGTTGRPKAAILSHRALIACVHNIYHFRDTLPHEIPAYAPQVNLFCCTPLFHIGGVLLQVQSLLSGHRLVLLHGRADGGRILDVLAREKVHVLSTVPTILARILDHSDFAAYDLSNLKTISAAGSMVSPELIKRARRGFANAGLATGSTYGMTESGGSVTMISGADHARKPTSAGRPFATCEVSVKDADASGEGELLIRGPSNMSGYWNRPEENLIDAEGWIHTGDLGRIDSDGFVHVTGRSKEIIIRGGENMAASVIEECLTEHPAVLEAAVIGLPHEELGEEVGAILVLRPGARVDRAELSQFVAERLAYFQVPTRWWLREEPLPTNAIGKVMKPALRAAWPEGQ